MNYHKSCTLSHYPERLNFNLTIRPILPNEQEDNHVFQLPSLEKSNISTYVTIKANEALAKNSDYWNAEINLVQTRQLDFFVPFSFLLSL